MNDRVFVIDDDEALRAMLEMQVQSIGFDCETFGNPADFLDSFGYDGAGCIVADVIMPEMTGLQLLRAAKERGIELPVIILTGHADVSIAVTAFRSGAFDFLEKPFSKGVFLEMLERAIAESRRAQGEGAQRSRVERYVELLTEREREVVVEMVKGDSNKQIARKLNISHRTIERHRQNVLKKIGVRSVLQLGELAEVLAARPAAAPAAPRLTGANVLHLKDRWARLG